MQHVATINSDYCVNKELVCTQAGKKVVKWLLIETAVPATPTVRKTCVWSIRSAEGIKHGI